MIKKNYVDELLTKYGRSEPEKLQPKSKCSYCEQRFNEDLLGTTFREEKDYVSANVFIDENIMTIKSTGGITRDRREIKFCPMCGRKLN